MAIVFDSLGYSRKLRDAGLEPNIAEAAADAAKGLADVKPASEAKKIDVVKELGELTQKEVMQVLTRGEVFVDGVARHDPGFPVGLFDVVSVPKEDKAFRLVPSPDGLVPRDIVSTEAGMKLCRVRSKVKITGGHIQFGFHDGRSMLDDKLAASCGDTVIMKVPKQAALDTQRGLWGQR